MSARTSGAGQSFNVRDHVVEDSKNRLFWIRDANMAGYRMSWDDAGEYIKSLNRRQFAGYSDWRLPDVDEIRNLTAAVQRLGGTNKQVIGIVTGLERAGFRNVQASEYWTSSSSIFSETEAWYFSLADGSKGMGSKSLYRYVWPVRWQRLNRK